MRKILPVKRRERGVGQTDDQARDRGANGRPLRALRLPPVILREDRNASALSASPQRLRGKREDGLLCAPLVSVVQSLFHAQIRQEVVVGRSLRDLVSLERLELRLQVLHLLLLVLQSLQVFLKELRLFRQLAHVVSQALLVDSDRLYARACRLDLLPHGV